MTAFGKGWENEPKLKRTEICHLDRPTHNHIRRRRFSIHPGILTTNAKQLRRSHLRTPFLPTSLIVDESGSLSSPPYATVDSSCCQKGLLHLYLDLAVTKNSKPSSFENFPFAGSPDFPTATYVNPTMTLPAPSFRLAEHLAKVIQGKTLGPVA